MDLLGPDQYVLERARFEGCRIIGPCVLIPMGSVFSRSSFDGPPNQVHWELPEGRLPIGGIIAESCLFDRCSFVGVGTALRREELQQLMEKQ